MNIQIGERESVCLSGTERFFFNKFMDFTCFSQSANARSWVLVSGSFQQFGVGNLWSYFWLKKCVMKS